MSWALASPFMLWGLLGISIPVIIHLLSRRRTVTIDWGAMQFLDLGRRAQQKFQITELLLMMGRMLLLALVALAVTRPFWQPRSATNASASKPGNREPRDTVIILDGSESMDRKRGERSPRDEAVAWSKTFAQAMIPGDSVAILLAKDRVRPLTSGLSYDSAKILDLLKNPPASRGSSDLPSAIAEALRVLDTGKNSATEIVILTDAQRTAWRPGEPRRWDLLRDLHKTMKGRAPRIASVSFGTKAEASAPDVAVGPIALPRGVYAPNASIAVSTILTNSGPGPATRSAELWIDGVAVSGTSQSVGPIPPGGKTPVTFRATIATPGSHLIGVKLSSGDDPLVANDLAERPVEVAEALPVLLVDGEPGSEPLSGEADFLRAALAPAEDEAPAVEAKVVRTADLDAKSLEGRRVVVLANVDQLSPSQTAALLDHLSEEGGVLIAPGDRVDEHFYNTELFSEGGGLLPAKLGDRKGNVNGKEALAHPAPGTFTGPALGPFSSGDRPALAEADLFAYRVLIPATSEPAASVIARLDTGDPWAVERRVRKGRVILMAGPLDAEGGTLPVNPDFVPLVHELIYRLADPAADGKPSMPGEPIVLVLAETPGAEVTTVALTRPDGSVVQTPVAREGTKAHLKIDDTGEPGIYRVALPGPAGGSAFVAVSSDPRENEPETLADAEAETLAKGWPMAFEPDAQSLDARLQSSSSGGPRPVWRWLILAALGGLCLEVFLTRSLVKSRGMTAPEEPGS